VAKYKSEAEAMRFARKAKIVKVPEVRNRGFLSFFAFFFVVLLQVFSVGVEPQSKVPFLCMEFVEGKSVRQAVKEGSIEPELLARRIVEAVKQLSLLPLPFPHIGGFDSSPLWYDGPPLGPCASLQEFAAAALKWSAERVEPDLATLLRKVDLTEYFQNSSDFRLVFRHGDLSLDNILLRADEMWFIDWEWSGVFDERDVWLELREVLFSLKQEPLLALATAVSASELRRFDELKELYMGVAWAEAMGDEEEKREELEYLKRNLEKI
jgi:aminoglycoside phosphotransferase (APT) family kinase protein